MDIDEGRFVLSYYKIIVRLVVLYESEYQMLRNHTCKKVCVTRKYKNEIFCEKLGVTLQKTR